MKQILMKKWAALSVALLIIFAITVGLYFAFSPSYSRIEVTLSRFDTPIITASIEGNEHLMGIDLGSKFLVILTPETLNHLKKSPSDPLPWRDPQGKPHEYKSFMISDLKIGSLKLDTLQACESDKKTDHASILWEDENDLTQDRESGTIGWPILKESNLCLDIPNKLMYFCSSFSTLQKKKLFPTTFVKIPFSESKAGITFSLEVNSTPRIFVLDTGCSVNMFRTSLLPDQDKKVDHRSLTFMTSNNFKIGSANFENTDLYSYEINDKIPVDGILGMEFLKNHPFYIDWKAQEIYFGTW